jgi:hypothetical protein
MPLSLETRLLTRYFFYQAAVAHQVVVNTVRSDCHLDRKGNLDCRVDLAGLEDFAVAPPPYARFPWVRSAGKIYSLVPVFLSVSYCRPQ